MVIDGSNKKVGADQNRVLAGISALLIKINNVELLTYIINYVEYNGSSTTFISSIPLLSHCRLNYTQSSLLKGPRFVANNGSLVPRSLSIQITHAK